jgi:hypothetical protein
MLLRRARGSTEILANLLTAFHTIFCLYALLCLLPFAKKQALAFLNESAALREGLGLIEF